MKTMNWVMLDSEYLNLRVDYSDEDEKKMFEAAKCYVTQFTPEEVRELIESESSNRVNVKFFRRFSVFKGMEKEFDFKQSHERITGFIHK